MENEIRELAGKITPTRYARMLHALAHRTRRMTVVLEDVFQPHNAAALLRSCDAFGIQEAHLIENKYKTRLSKNVDMGTSKWMDVFHHTSPEAQRPESKRNRQRQYAQGSAVAEGKGVFASRVHPARWRNGHRRHSRGQAHSPARGNRIHGPKRRRPRNVRLPVLNAHARLRPKLQPVRVRRLCIANLSARMRALGDDWKMTEPEKQALLLSWLKRKDYSQ